jgi:hypothetical protein
MATTPKRESLVRDEAGKGSKGGAGGGASGGKGSKGHPDDAGSDSKKKVMIGVACVCILVAGGLIAWNLGLLSKAEPAGLSKIVPVEQTLPEERKEEYKKNLKLQEEQLIKSGTPAGS